MNKSAVSIGVWSIVEIAFYFLMNFESNNEKQIKHSFTAKSIEKKPQPTIAEPMEVDDPTKMISPSLLDEPIDISQRKLDPPNVFESRWKFSPANLGDNDNTFVIEADSKISTRWNFT